MAGLSLGAAAPDAGAQAPSIPSPSQLKVAQRAVLDICECVVMLNRYGFEGVEPAVLQMVQKRVHELAHGASQCLAGEASAIAVHGDLFPFESIPDELEGA